MSEVTNFDQFQRFREMAVRGIAVFWVLASSSR